MSPLAETSNGTSNGTARVVDWIRRPLEAFHRLRDAGAFRGHEDEWVAIKDGSVVGYYPTQQTAIASGLNGKTMVFPVDDKNMPVYGMGWQGMNVKPTEW